MRTQPQYWNFTEAVAPVALMVATPLTDCLWGKKFLHIGGQKLETGSTLHVHHFYCSMQMNLESSSSVYRTVSTDWPSTLSTPSQAAMQPSFSCCQYKYSQYHHCKCQYQSTTWHWRGWGGGATYICDVRYATQSRSLVHELWCSDPTNLLGLHVHVKKI